jgi:epoxide hydrolase-like predicted phosphatase
LSIACKSVTTAPMRIAAVIFDLGGVVLDSPLEAFSDYERMAGLPQNTINRAIVAGGPSGAWSRLERGELAMDEFYGAFDAETRASGIALSARALMDKVADDTQVRPAVIAAIRRIRQRGVSTAALTNNWFSDDQRTKMDVLRDEFDVFIESARAGLRKPDPRIYRLACEQLRVDPTRAAFLDDIGANLKPAREMGMTTIKVTDYRDDIAELGELLDIELGP